MSAWTLSCVVLAGLVAITPRGAAQQVRLGAESLVPDNPRSHFSRYVNWRPADGETVTLNPPRMSWPYRADWPEDWGDARHTFTLQVSAAPDMADPVVNVTTWFNFYNTLPALEGAATWYWRVGYDVGTAQEHWSPVRSFTVAPEAVVWDRAHLAAPDLPARGHPRILLTRENRERMRSLADTNEASRAALDHMRAHADRVLQRDWWGNFPPTDREAEPAQHFYTIAHDLATVAFVWKITGDDRYAGVVERAVTWASYPPGGRSSPEGLGGDGHEDATQGNEFLALLFDWLHEDFTNEQRGVMIASLEWRVDHIMNNFSWSRGASRQGSGAMLRITWQRQEGGDERLRLTAAEEWQRFEWEVAVPEGVTAVRVEPFNYYNAGTVWWGPLEIRADPDGPNLVDNPDFTRADGDAPENWRPHAYGTNSRFLHDPAGGPEGTGTVAVICDEGSDRGAVGQTVRFGATDWLYVRGWYRTDLPALPPTPPARVSGGLAGMTGSHQYEAAMDTAVCGLVLYEYSNVGRRWFELALNYLLGVTGGFGFDEASNEGAGYGSSKMKWLMNATMYFDAALPGANLGLNPYYRRMGDWLCRIIPVGMDHHAWGDQRNASRGNHLAKFRKLAYLTGEGRFLYNWQQYGGQTFSTWRPWIEYSLPAFYQEPVPEPEQDPVALFDVAGWAMAATGPPSDPATYRDGAGIIFQCRPSGGYSHSYNSDLSFQLHAYGQMLNHGGGNSANLDAYPRHAMSHSTILVDGLGQAQPASGMLHPAYGRVVGFSRGEDYFYVAGDATNAYPAEPGNFRRWSFPIHEVYQERALPHLEQVVRHILFVKGRYFVIYDDLRAAQPATFTWLYHIRPQEPFSFDADSFTVDYAVQDVAVRLRHIFRPDALALDDRQGEDALVNPFTGEDYRQWLRGDILCGHSLWVSNAEPATEWNFLAVVYPGREGDDIPAIEPVDDHTVRVGEDVICFDPDSPAADAATILVDVAAFRR